MSGGIGLHTETDLALPSLIGCGRFVGSWSYGVSGSAPPVHVSHCPWGSSFPRFLLFLFSYSAFIFPSFSLSPPSFFPFSASAVAIWCIASGELTGESSFPKGVVRHR